MNNGTPLALTAVAAAALFGRRRGSPARLRMAGLKKGTILYHGTQAQEDFEYPDGPAWFSTARPVAVNFARWNVARWSKRGGATIPRVLTFRVNRNIPRMVLLEDRLAFYDLAKRIDMDDESVDYASPTELADAVCDSDLTGWHVPWNYPEGSDTLICDPAEWLDFVKVEIL